MGDIQLSENVGEESSPGRGSRGILGFYCHNSIQCYIGAWEYLETN